MDDNEISRLVELAAKAVYECSEKGLLEKQKYVLEQCLLGKTLEEIDLELGTGNYVRTRMAPQLWKLLSKALGKRVHKRNLYRILKDELKSSQDKQLRSQKAKNKAKTKLNNRVVLNSSASGSELIAVKATLFDGAILKLSSENEREQTQGNGSQREEVGENLPETTTLLGSSTPRSSKLNKFMKSGLALLIALGAFGTWFSLSWLANWYGVKSYLAGQLPHAELSYKIALKLIPFSPLSAPTHYNLGLVYEDQQDYQQAQIQYQLAIKGGVLSAYNSQARLYILTKNYNAAVALLRIAIPLEKDQNALYSMFKNRGWARLEQGRLEEANQDLTQAIALRSDRAPAYCLLAQVLERQGENTEAISEWGNCLDYAYQPQTPEEDQWINLAQQRLKAAEVDGK